jgi:hypothetical protein
MIAEYNFAFADLESNYGKWSISARGDDTEFFISIQLHDLNREFFKCAIINSETCQMMSNLMAQLLLHRSCEIYITDMGVLRVVTTIGKIQEFVFAEYIHVPQIAPVQDFPVLNNPVQDEQKRDDAPAVDSKFKDEGVVDLSRMYETFNVTTTNSSVFITSNDFAKIIPKANPSLMKSLLHMKDPSQNIIVRRESFPSPLDYHKIVSLSIGSGPDKFVYDIYHRDNARGILMQTGPKFVELWGSLYYVGDSIPYGKKFRHSMWSLHRFKVPACFIVGKNRVYVRLVFGLGSMHIEGVSSNRVHPAITCVQFKRFGVIRFGTHTDGKYTSQSCLRINFKK